MRNDRSWASGLSVHSETFRKLHAWTSTLLRARNAFPRRAIVRALALEYPGASVARSQGRTIARDSMRELASECKSGHAPGPCGTGGVPLMACPPGQLWSSPVEAVSRKVKKLAITAILAIDRTSIGALNQLKMAD